MSAREEIPARADGRPAGPPPCRCIRPSGPLKIDEIAAPSAGPAESNPSIVAGSNASPNWVAARAGNNARGMPKAVVVDDGFNWGRREERPVISWEDTIIYEAHVKGFTWANPEIPENPL